MAEPNKTRRDKRIQDEVSESVDLIWRYAKQETLDPLKALGRYLAAGMAGAVLLAIGLLLLAIGGLRALQQELAPHLSGNWSWAPYLIVVVLGGILIALLARAIGADKRRGDRQRIALRDQKG